ncbi:hypothetical protein FQN54_006478 [Arachnomyces sp. PD_36]|nr:hypothetical protein FQN54_006478 [Arachnomyces sp. PD_36]
MLRSTILSSSILVALLAQTGAAWTWTWRDASESPHIDRGTGYQSCTNIDHEKGQVFAFDAEKSYVCLLMYGQKDCTGDVGGYGCSVYTKESSGDILSYQVVDGDYYDDPSIISSTSSSSSAETTAPSTSSSSTATATTLTTSGTKPDSTADPATSPPAEEEEGGDSSLSGGAIAGIVIGVLAALAIGAILAWFLMRRRKDSPTSGPSPYEGAKPAVKASSLQTDPKAEDKAHAESQPPMSDKWGSPTSPTEQDEPGPSPYTTRPPAGTPLVELSSNNQIVELDASSQHRQ